LQTVNSFEVIVINDGSTDATASICQKYAEMDSRVRFINQPHKGIAFTRNHLLDLAQGEWITFIDADDYVSDNFLALFLQQIEQTPSINVFICRPCSVKRGKMMPSSPFKGNKKQYYEALIGKDYAKVDSCLLGKVIRRSSIEQYYVRCLEHFSLGEDLYFLVSLLYYMDSISYVDGQIYFYNRDNTGSITHLVLYVEEEVTSFQEVIRFIYSHPDFHEYDKAINRGKMRIRHSRYLHAMRFPDSNISQFVYNDVKYRGLPLSDKLRLFLINHRLPLLLKVVDKIFN